MACYSKNDNDQDFNYRLPKEITKYGQIYDFTDSLKVTL